MARLCPMARPPTPALPRKGGGSPGKAFGPAATVPNGAQAPNLHGRSPDGAAAVRRSTPAKSGSGIAEARGVRRAAKMPDPAQPTLQAGTPARRPPLPNETKN